jgi:TonB family protein
MIQFLRLLFLLISISAFCEEKVFYNQNGEITIPELATHYRVGIIDPINRKFKGRVTEFDINERLILELNYDSLGFKNGYFKYDRFGYLIEGRFDKDHTTTVVPDSIVQSISKKERFVQSIFIRKRDYPNLRRMLSSVSYSADSVVLNGEVFTVVEETPTFPGGMTGVGKFLSYHLIYPKLAKEKKITGKVFVRFTIMPDGTIDNIKTIKGLGHGCDEAAEFAIGMLPDWKPGYQRGKAVPVSMVIPIRFD